MKQNIKAIKFIKEVLLMLVLPLFVISATVGLFLVYKLFYKSQMTMFSNMFFALTIISGICALIIIFSIYILKAGQYIKAISSFRFAIPSLDLKSLNISKANTLISNVKTMMKKVSIIFFLSNIKEIFSTYINTVKLKNIVKIFGHKTINVFSYLKIVLKAHKIRINKHINSTDIVNN